MFSFKLQFSTFTLFDFYMKNLGLCLLSGVLLAISWPTYGIPFFLFIAFVPMLWAIHSWRENEVSKWKIFGGVYLGFLVWTTVATWWVYNSTPFGGIFSVLANTLLMSLVMLIFMIVNKRLDTRAGLVFFCSIWLCFEYMHLHWEFSYPWLNLGNGFAHFPKVIQWYEFTGTFGGSLWVLISNVVIFQALWSSAKSGQPWFSFKRKSIFVSVWILLPVIASLVRYHTYEENGKEVNVLILQPNIDPYTEKYLINNERIGLLLDSLSSPYFGRVVDFIIAPETVFAQNIPLSSFSTSAPYYKGLQWVQKFPQAHTLAGFSPYERFRDPSRATVQTNVIKENDFYNDYNSAFFVRPDGSSEVYHKSRLVVGVENFPYQGILKPILGDVMLDLGGTVAKKTTQEDREVFMTRDSVGAAPIICYESIYGEYVTGYIRNGANFLSIITNDAWWGDTQGYRQHLAYARLRAIETRRAIARSANTGISAILNQRGDVEKFLPYGERGSIYAPVHLNTGWTLYVRFGNFLARIALFVSALLFLFAIAKKKER